MNPHHEEAERLSTESSLINDWGLTERQIIATRTQAEATLSLAYEQRTANLIAMFGQARDAAQELMQPAFADPDSFAAKQLAKWNEMGKQIEERLGLA